MMLQGVASFTFTIICQSRDYHKFALETNFGN